MSISCPSCCLVFVFVCRVGSCSVPGVLPGRWFSWPDWLLGLHVLPSPGPSLGLLELLPCPRLPQSLELSHFSNQPVLRLCALPYCVECLPASSFCVPIVVNKLYSPVHSASGSSLDKPWQLIDYSSAFNKIVPIKLSVKLTDLCLNSSLCDWIQDFLTCRPQVVKVGQFTSNSITLNIGAPQGCVLSPLLYSLYTHDCVSSHSSTSIVKFADDTVVLGLISNNDETACLDEVERFTSWCQDNCLSLNVSKTKELIVDFRKRQQRLYTPLMIRGTPVEWVSSFKYLGVNISEDLTWITHIQTQVKKARQRLYLLRQLRKFRVSPAILKTFYSGAIESVLTLSASRCGMETSPIRSAKLCRESCA